MSENKTVNVLGNIYNNIKKGVSLKKTLIMLQGSGRCFAPGTMVRMYDGTLKEIEHIRIGDKVMRMDGNGYSKVIEVHSGLDMMYKIHQNKGIDYIVNSHHILSMKQTQSFTTHGFFKKPKPIPYDKNAILDISVENFITKSRNFKERFAGFKNTLIQLPKKYLLIDPYYLGMWIGDGCSARWHEITNTDKEVIDWFYGVANGLGVRVRFDDKCTYIMDTQQHMWRNKKVVAMREAFKHYQLINNKHVPSDYIYGDYEDRLAFLAGLIDSDGTNTRRNTISICQKNRCILEAVLEICRLSGFYTNGIGEKVSKMKRKDGSVYECKTYFIEINHKNFADLNKYIKIPRKRIEKSCDRDYFVTRLSVEEQGLGEYFGFTLEGDPHFLLEDGTVVHNSGKTYNTLIYLVLECMQNPIRHRKVTDPVTRREMNMDEPLLISIVRESMPVIRRSVYRDFQNVMLSMGIWNDRCMNKTEWVYSFPNGAKVEFFSADDEQKLRGPSRHILYINEANEIDYYAFSMLRQRTYEYTIVDYNPSFTEEHWLFPLIKDNRSYHFISTYKDNIFLPRPAVEEIESYKETNPALWEIFGLGHFAIIEGLVFPRENWDIVPDSEYPVWKAEEELGIDWGFVSDPTVVVGVIIVGNDIYVREHLREVGMLTESIAKFLKKPEFNGLNKHCDIDNRLTTELELAGVNMLIPTKKNGDTIITGIRLMNQRHIHITQSSTDLVKEFRNYVYKKDRHEIYQTDLKPIDKFNHGIDALRYVVLSRFGDSFNGNIDREITKQDLNLFM